MVTPVGVKIATKKTTKFITSTRNVGKTLRKNMGYQKSNTKRWKNVKGVCVLVANKTQEIGGKMVPWW